MVIVRTVPSWHGLNLKKKQMQKKRGGNIVANMANPEDFFLKEEVHDSTPFCDQCEHEGGCINCFLLRANQLGGAKVDCVDFMEMIAH